jgi:hypothetical protein
VLALTAFFNTSINLLRSSLLYGYDTDDDELLKEYFGGLGETAFSGMFLIRDLVRALVSHAQGKRPFSSIPGPLQSVDKALIQGDISAVIDMATGLPASQIERYFKGKKENKSERKYSSGRRGMYYRTPTRRQ